ncbi:MAG: hypothetical protein HY652_03820 [Acidobacteria bacterium]|nr:hypothetical protein [Acidobacteriota bacterium]
MLNLGVLPPNGSRVFSLGSVALDSLEVDMITVMHTGRTQAPEIVLAGMQSVFFKLARRAPPAARIQELAENDPFNPLFVSEHFPDLLPPGLFEDPGRMRAFSHIIENQHGFDEVCGFPGTDDGNPNTGMSDYGILPSSFLTGQPLPLLRHASGSDCALRWNISFWQSGYAWRR